VDVMAILVFGLAEADRHLVVALAARFLDWLCLDLLLPFLEAVLALLLRNLLENWGVD
jgi:hypothetical protein